MKREEFIKIMSEERDKVVNKIQNLYDMDSHTKSFACSMVYRLYTKTLDKIKE